MEKKKKEGNEGHLVLVLIITSLLVMGHVEIKI